ncbi:nicotianamine synthase family protein [Paenibacillus assamensis]|uniref:nicotianamine synthase family protein n=1 Tax=Paenibacillus assamensis TaxID=311244 RepID=UPI0003F893EC|nr:nicotianamine synthase family protein [Paenibacillus assamensis]
MKDKYHYLLSLKLLEFEIRELTAFSKQYGDCFELLKDRLDYLCQFMINHDNLERWSQWGNHIEIVEYAEKVREASIQALCDMEKYQAQHTCERASDISDYLDILAGAVNEEMKNHNIDSNSKVLFIGSGAFPTTALTIARETSAQVVCLDIDPEAIEWSEQVAAASGLSGHISFTNKKVQELPFTIEATHIIIASLVKNKLEVLEELRQHMNPFAKVIVRYGNGLKSIFNYPLEEDVAHDWVHHKMDDKQNLYDTLVLEKR